MTRPEAEPLAEILAALGPLDGREILDVGCGRGRLVAALAERGATVSAVDPDPTSVEAARRAAPGATVVEAGGEALPFEDARFDGVIMLNSLHHVPGGSLGEALAGAARVAKPAAPIVVVEPLAEGSFFDAMRPVEDETEIRAAAQAAISLACGESGPLDLVETREFERVERFSDVAQFLERLIAVDPARRAKAQSERAEVERLFRALAEPVGDRFALRQPLRMHMLQPR